METMLSDLSSEIRDVLDVINGSPFMDEVWYRREYGLRNTENAALHYLLYGAKLGYWPGPFFDPNLFLCKNDEARDNEINPIVYLELSGKKTDIDVNVLKQIRKAYPELVTDMEHGLIRIRVTNACNALCRYCGVRLGVAGAPDLHMNPVWYMEELKSLYKKVDMVLLTGGDPYILPQSYELMKLLGMEYMHLTVMTESNAIAFDENFQTLASDCLFSTHFSINASDRHVYQDSCWESKNGEIVYDKMLNNIENYVRSLTKTGKLCFAPSISMVVNKDNYQDIVKFTKRALSLHAKSIDFYFDYTENNMSAPYFTNPSIMRSALKKMMEMERVLAEKVMVKFRLWIPYKEAKMLQDEVDGVDINELRKRYSDVLELAEGRSIELEFEERNEWRKKLGKNELTFDQDFAPTLKMEKRCGKNYCFAPWKELDLYPDGRLDFCGWYRPTLNINDYMVNGHINWEESINSYEFMRERKKILQKNYDKCQACCPLNDVANAIISPYEFGYGRVADRKYGWSGEDVE